MIDPTATARCRPLNPRPSSNLPSPSLSIAHQPHMLHPHRPRPLQLQRLHVHRLQIRATRRYLSPALHQLHGYPLCFPFNLFRTLQLYQHPLPLQQLLDPTAQHRPMLRCYRKLTAEIEQRALPAPAPRYARNAPVGRSSRPCRLRHCASWCAG